MLKLLYLSLPQPVVGLVVNHSIHILMHFTCRGLHLRGRRSNYKEAEKSWHLYRHKFVATYLLVKANNETPIGCYASL